MARMLPVHPQHVPDVWEEHFDGIGGGELAPVAIEREDDEKDDEESENEAQARCPDITKSPIYGGIAAAYHGVDAWGMASLKIRIYADDDTDLGSGTCFHVWHGPGSKSYFVTNDHNLRPAREDQKNPTYFMIDLLPKDSRDSARLAFRIELYDDPKQLKQPRWLAHPLGPRVDVVALPCNITDPQVLLAPVCIGCTHHRNANVKLYAGTQVSVIGYMFGEDARLMPIWKSGHIAVDPAMRPRVVVDNNNKKESIPVFHIDATTRQGLSGSPVVARMFGTYNCLRHRKFHRAGVTTVLLGIYSGRLSGHQWDSNREGNVGIVWTCTTICQVLRDCGKVYTGTA